MIDYVRLLALARQNWKEILLILLLLAVLGKSRYDYRQLQMAYEASQDSLQTQIEGLRGIHAEELEARDIALNDYQERIEELEMRRVERGEEIRVEIDNTREQYIEDFSHDKEALISAIQDKLGFEYVE